MTQRGLLAVYKRGDDDWATPRGLKLAQNWVAMINRQNKGKKRKKFLLDKSKLP